MNVLTNPRILAALAGLVGVVAGVLYPGTDEGRIVALLTTVLTFLAGLFQPAPQPPKVEAKK